MIAAKRSWEEIHLDWSWRDLVRLGLEPLIAPENVAEAATDRVSIDLHAGTDLTFNTQTGQCRVQHTATRWSTALVSMPVGFCHLSELGTALRAATVGEPLATILRGHGGAIANALWTGTIAMPAQAWLDDQVQAGHVRVFGRGSPLEPFRQVPADTWARCEIVRWVTGLARCGPAHLHSLHMEFIDATSVSTLSADEQCRRFLVTRMAASPAEPTATRGELQEQAMTHFGVSARRFLQLWAESKREAGADAWGKAGRRQKT